MLNHPIIHETKLNENTGEITIESDNIDKFTIKYYLIDVEILFSSTPFIKDQAEHFSYVKPYMQLDKPTQRGVATKLPLPNELKGKNVVIEINSDEVQKFKTYYSSQLKVKIDEADGEVRVFNRETMKPLAKVYVKVFCKKGNKEELFYIDGFTDIRGKFIYLRNFVYGQRGRSQIKKFSIFVCDTEHKNGCSIIEVDPPEAPDEDGYDEE